MPKLTINSPAFLQWLAVLPENLIWGQVWILTSQSSETASFELRHIADKNVPSESLSTTSISQLRALALNTETGQFRPIKASPNLRRGWRAVAQDARQLEESLELLYPGSIADWAAVQNPNFSVGTFREFTGRQTGMYRITQLLDDMQAGQAIAACCAASFCLKRRYWTVDALAPDDPSIKSLIPCLEPCAVMLEFARKAIKIDREDKFNLSLAAPEIDSIREALEHLRKNPSDELREGDVNASANPRRLQLLLGKLSAISPPPKENAPE